MVLKFVPERDGYIYIALAAPVGASDSWYDWGNAKQSAHCQASNCFPTCFLSLVHSIAPGRCSSAMTRGSFGESVSRFCCTKKFGRRVSTQGNTDVHVHTHRTQLITNHTHTRKWHLLAEFAAELNRSR